MKELSYRILGRKKHILKAILITSLILIISFIIVLLPQLISPHILSKYLNGLSGGNVEIKNDEIVSLDIGIYGASNDPSFIDNFSQIVEASSEKIYGIYQPKSLNLFALGEALYLNETYGNQTPSYVSLVGLSSNFFEAIKPYTENHNPVADVIFLTNLQYESFNCFNVSINGLNTTINYDDVIFVETFTEYFPYSSKLLLPIITYNSDNNSMFPCFLYKIDDFIARYDPYMQYENNEYMIYGYICFDEEQQEIIAWTIDAKSKMNNFKTEIIETIQNYNPSTMIEFDVNIYGDENLINIVYSFIRGLQITFWSIGIIVICLAVSKIQEKNKEQRALIAGQKWHKRVRHLLIESILTGGGGAILAFVVIYPFVKMQVLFNIDLTINIMTILWFGIITLTFIVSIFIVYLDYEYYLRRTLIKPEENYKLFKKIPKYLYIIPFGLIILLIWLLNRNIISVLVFVGFITIILIIAISGTYFLRFFIEIGKGINELHKRKRKIPLSLIDALTTLWKKKLFSKILLFSFLISVVSAVFLYANFNADAQKTSLLWMNGGEIKLEGAYIDTTTLDPGLRAINEIDKFIKVLKIDRFVNETDSYPFGIVSNTIKPVNNLYTGPIVKRIYAINTTSYVDYYESWGMKKWISKGQIIDLNNNTCFVTQEFKTLGFDIGNNLNLFNGSSSMILKGFIKTLPAMVGTYNRNELIILMDYRLLLKLLTDNESGFIIRYHLRCDEEFIETVIEELILIKESSGIDSIDYMAPNVAANIRIVFLKPIIIVFQLFLIIWGVTYIYGNMDEVNQSIDAKNLGMIAFAGDYRKTLRNFKILEGFMLFFIFLINFGIIYGLSYIILPILGSIGTVQRIIVSGDTWLNITFLLISYPLLLIIQGIAEYLKYRTIDLSMIYRHPE
ncbi:MAG: hypothetical protein JXA54_03490 [Candidatus Heimdallarchaeota archaeon]|nr:hypothetical protein [Candidatus Heimdallarchaeota archaeon]